MPLPKDNPIDRGRSDKWDAEHGGKWWYEKAARPVVHGVYHAARGAGLIEDTPNYEDLVRAKDVFSAIGTGQTQTEYLKIYREEQKKIEEQKKLELYDLHKRFA